MDEIVSSYDKLRGFESSGCTKEELLKELINIRDVSGEMPSLLVTILKENPQYAQVLAQFVGLFKPPFLPTIKSLIPLYNTQTIATEWKTQASFIMAIMNNDGYIDGIKAISTLLK
ncbi:hypothetical protein [Candidatus Nitrosotenuis sp. DW1]|uniref:hypothetical protein n=1 Tax=Candidatus Nitrosotenuis sp. DW1 TaxID=2259672 RepID=UPI0015CD4532|nr:hypothetical protein [Candidatus Nitrosotenuis sp. DW1]QLH08928.1 hypothetical protein DSQ19_05015 [Candidatus Nitrosotenuis sp. DW1]